MFWVSVIITSNVRLRVSRGLIGLTAETLHFMSSILAGPQRSLTCALQKVLVLQ